MLKDKRVLVIGGSSGMGLEIARAAGAQGARVVIAGRSTAKLDMAVESLKGAEVLALSADIGDQEQVGRLFAQAGETDHLVVTAADLAYGPVDKLTEGDIMPAVRSKLLGPIFAAQQCARYLRPGGSIVLTTGIAARRPMVGGSVAAALNGALEGLGRALAIELAPVRVNMLSPGWTDTPIWDTMPGMTAHAKRDRFDGMGKRLPVGRIGNVQDIASAALFLMANSFVTGTVLDVDGGHRLV